ncbi:hypothetical protein Poli38472_005341 [Pythium oligandrum]|uniref:Cytochrome P450 n=1 Tax=Pythium oligandrum TaxID=41045 RepID=A0A8K1CHS9_PYTOL|nr:hypothetical protein Poli38472_005341 [Pythium oligandrum]|eukprot:TMW62723.1 hypothetical protein Poli38472_005341 [Pythium oligandrum]
MVLQTLFEKGRVAAEELNGTHVVVGALLIPVTLMALQRAYTALTKKDDTVSVHKPLFRPSTTLPWLENTIDFAGRVARFHHWMVEVCTEGQGRPVQLRSLGQPPIVIVSTPELVEDVMKTQFDAFPKGEQQCELVGGIVGDGIFAADGVKWARQRKTASHLFTARTLRESMTATMRKHTAVLLRILQCSQQTGQSIDLFNLLNRFTIEAFSEIGFGIQMNCVEAEEEHPFQSAFDGAQRTIVLRFMVPPWFWKAQRFLGVGSEGQFKKDLKVIDDTVLGIIAQSIERRQRNGNVSSSVDLVSLFLDHFDKSSENEGEEVDVRYLRDVIVSFLIAGRDTTAQAISWFFLSIHREPLVAHKIRREIQTMLPELYNGKVETPTMEQVQQLTYLEATLKETLRLYPSVPCLPKSADRDVVLCDGSFIKKGSRVAIPAYAMGRMPYIWGPDAEEFKPERWIDPETGKIIPVSPFKFFSFNAGPRMCLGMNLALLEMKIVAASVLSRFEISVLNDKEVTYDFSMTLPVLGAMRVDVDNVSKS